MEEVDKVKYVMEKQSDKLRNLVEKY